MRQRISELEGTIGQIVQRLDALGFDTGELLKDLDLEVQPSSTSLAIAHSDRLRISEDLNSDVADAPLLALFDNDVLCLEDVSSGPNAQSLDSCRGRSSTTSTYGRILRHLRPLIPSTQTLDIVLRHSHLSICMLRKSFAEVRCRAPYGSDGSELESLRNWMIESFTSEDIATLPKVLICLATCIQQLPGDVEIGTWSLQVPLELLHIHYMDCAEAFLSPDDGLVGSIEGVDCLLTQVRFYLNAGLPRKAWVIFRRAATFAQLLGTHHQRFPDEEPDMYKIGLWLQLFSMDKSLSLLLGLPYMISDFPYKVGSDTRTSHRLPPKLLFMLELGDIAKRVIDRNGQGQRNLSVSETFKLDHDLEQCKLLMPSSWWNTLPDSSMAIDTVYETSILQFWFHNLRDYIHLPFILKRSTNPKCQHTAFAAIQSSREMIRIYNTLRDANRPIIRLCNAMDFQVLTAALIITLSLLETSSMSDAAQDEQDWQTIYGLTYTMSRAAQAMPDSVAAQAVQLLEDLCKLRYDFAGSNETFHVVLPYFGEIRIRRRRPGASSHGPPPQLPEPIWSEGFAPEQIDLPQRGSSLPLRGEVAAPADLPGAALFDHSDYFSFSPQEAWPGLDQSWTSMVDFSLQNDWDWYFDNSALHDSRL